MNFDMDEYQTGDHDPAESYVVVWRDTPKPPKGGWKCYACHIILVSDRIAKLENQLQIIGGTESPFVVDAVSNVEPKISKSKVVTVTTRSMLMNKGKSKFKHEIPTTSRASRSPPPKSKRMEIEMSHGEDMDIDDGNKNNFGNKSRWSRSSEPLPNHKLSQEKSKTTIQSRLACSEFQSSSGTVDRDDDIRDDPEMSERESPLPSHQRPYSRQRRSEVNLSSPIQSHCLRYELKSDGREDVGNEDANKETEETGSPLPRYPELDVKQKHSSGKSVLPNQSQDTVTDNQEDLAIEKEPTLRDIMAVLQTNGAAIRKLNKEVDDLKKNRGAFVRQPPLTRNLSNANGSYEDDFPLRRVEVGKPGSGITVSESEWTSAISRGTYSAMATTLLTALFPMEVLLKSNYKGGKCKIKKSDAESVPHYTALDQQIVKAIMYSVQAAYPKKFDEGGFGKAINQKLTHLRNPSKKS